MCKLTIHRAFNVKILMLACFNCTGTPLTWFEYAVLDKDQMYNYVKCHYYRKCCFH